MGRRWGGPCCRRGVASPPPLQPWAAGCPWRQAFFPRGALLSAPGLEATGAGQSQSVTSKPRRLTNACHQTPDLPELFPDPAGIWWWAAPVGPRRLNTSVS